jgi:GNAT superfamily N-acetyltransferase
MVTLCKAEEADCPELHRILVKSFAPLLKIYRDYGSSPASESLDEVVRRFRQSYTDYYFILLDEVKVGVLRVCDFGAKCRLSPIGILPQFQGRGIAQQALTAMEALYPQAHTWTLDTILQEPKLCHLYEKLGYRRTGKYEHIQEGMDLVFYEKEVNRNA